MFKTLGLIFLCLPSIALASECTVLLHGLARSQNSMSLVSEALVNEGYKVVNQGYDSTNHTIQNLAQVAIPKAIEACDTPSTIHFVTHSMGGILVRYYLSEHTIENLGRVVMLGPPNHGSEVVDKLKDFPGFEFVNGPAGMQLGTGETSITNSLGAVNFDTGIIAGTRSINLILSTQLPNPDDGKVSVESTKIEGMNDHIELPVTHTFMMRNEEVIKQIIHYLKFGQFNKED